MAERLSELVTEGRSRYTDLDTFSVREILTALNEEDKRVPEAVARVIPEIEEAVLRIVKALSAGGRLFYVGAGTSGRLGVLDASECPPTFGVDPELVQGVIAGGETALRHPVENVEDRREEGAHDVKARGVNQGDVVVGIAASGRTPYVLGALDEAGRVGATTVALVCNPGSPMAELVQIVIAPVVGSEVLMGSTRMKAGTAQKLVLNMLTTTTMIRLGKVYSNLMVDLQASNAKLVDRAVRIVQLATGCTPQQATESLERAGGRAKTAIVMALVGCDKTVAERLLNEAGGFVREALRLGK